MIYLPSLKMKFPSFLKGCQTTSGKYCVFPFKYKGKVHSKCTKEDSKNGAYWCATAVDTNQDAVHGAWDDCGQGCPLDMDMDEGD